MIVHFIKFIVTQKQALFGTFKSWNISWFENPASPDTISSNPQALISSGSDAQI